MDLLVLETSADDLIIDGVETDSYRKAIIYVSTDLLLNIFPCLDSVTSTGVLTVNM